MNRKHLEIYCFYIYILISRHIYKYIFPMKNTFKKILFSLFIPHNPISNLIVFNITHYLIKSKYIKTDFSYCI